jgi:hypothetical protein
VASAPARNAAGQPGAEPTNWASFFSGPTWELDAATGEYYMHLFSRKQPDLNWENPEVRQAIYAMMRWWLGPRRRRLPHGRHQHDSKDTSLPDGVPFAAAGWATAGRISSAARATTSSSPRCTARFSAIADRPLLTVG